MIGRVNSFIIPNRQSHYINQNSVQQAVRALDQNNDGRLNRDELEISRHLLQQVDRNGDRTVSLFEMENALNNNKVSVSHLNHRAARALASSVMGEWAYAAGFGNLGRVLDSDADGYVTRREMASALSRGSVVLSGSYLTTGQADGPGGPGGPGQGWGVTASEAREHIQSFENNKMKKDRWGNNDPTTGIFTPQEANQKIKSYLEDKVLSSEAMSLREKFDLLKGQEMKKDRWGNYDPAIGSLTGKESSTLAQRVAKEIKTDQRDRDFASSYLNTISSEKMKADRWGNDDYTTGLLTPSQANQLVKDFIQNTIVNSRRLGTQEKLDLIKGQAMKKDRWGNDDPRTGALTANEVNNLSKKVFEQGHQDPFKDEPFGQDPFDRPGHTHPQDPFGKDPFAKQDPLDKIGDILDKIPFGKDPFRN